MRTRPYSTSGLLRRFFLERILDVGERLELDRPGRAVLFLDLADVDILHDVAGARIDRDRTARAFPFHALHGADHGIGIGIAAGLFQRLVDQIHAVIAADRDEIGAVAGRLL